MIACHTIDVSSNAAVLLLSAQITRNEKEGGDDKGDMYRRLALWYEWIDAVVLLGVGGTHYRVLHLFTALRYLENIFSDPFCKAAHAVTGKTEAISGVISKGISSFALSAMIKSTKMITIAAKNSCNWSLMYFVVAVDNYQISCM